MEPLTTQFLSWKTYAYLWNSDIAIHNALYILHVKYFFLVDLPFSRHAAPALLLMVLISFLDYHYRALSASNCVCLHILP